MNSQPNDLVTIIKREAEAVTRFVELLREEQETLRRGDVEALELLVEKKTHVASSLAQLGEQRNATLAAKGFVADRVGVESWLSSESPGPGADQAWEAVIAGASQAKELNRVNGSLIQIRMQYNTLAVEALLKASRPLNLYGPDGQTAPYSGRRINDAV